MILIAHRGNYNSVQPDNENTIPYLHAAISHGYDIEVDIRLTAEGFMLGHDGPVYPITKLQIKEISGHAWFHAKNYEALVALTDEGHHVFAHDQDPWALTSRNIIWSHNHHYNPKGIVCMPDIAVDQQIIAAARGVCHDRLDWIERLLVSEIVG